MKTTKCEHTEAMPIKPAWRSRLFLAKLESTPGSDVTHGETVTGLQLTYDQQVGRTQRTASAREVLPSAAVLTGRAPALVIPDREDEP